MEIKAGSEKIKKRLKWGLLVVSACVLLSCTSSSGTGLVKSQATPLPTPSGRTSEESKSQFMKDVESFDLIWQVPIEDLPRFLLPLDSEGNAINMSFAPDGIYRTSAIGKIILPSITRTGEFVGKGNFEVIGGEHSDESYLALFTYPSIEDARAFQSAEEEAHFGGEVMIVEVQDGFIISVDVEGGERIYERR